MPNEHSASDATQVDVRDARPTAAPLAVRPAPSISPSSALSIQCASCGTKMQPEHAHDRCLACGYRDSCCM